MTDINSIADDYRRYNEALSKANQVNKDVVFDALATTGLTRITVNFDGVGDSGQIDDIAAYENDTSVPIPAIAVKTQRVEWFVPDPASIETLLSDAIENLCYDYLSQAHGGWENNDGAFGEFTFDVAKRSIDLDFNARFIESALYTYTF